MEGRPLLLVEDDTQLSALLCEALTDSGYAVDVAADGQRGLHLALTRRYAVMIVDRLLPAIEGVDLISRLRAQGIATPSSSSPRLVPSPIASRALMPAPRTTSSSRSRSKNYSLGSEHCYVATQTPPTR